MYYRLTYNNSWQGHKAGDGILCAKRPLDIGQTAACDVAIPESDLYEPLLFATILPLESDGWCIVRRTDSFDITVNGKPLMSALQLHDGDSICFSGFGNAVQFTFNIRKDSDYDDASGVVVYHQPRRRALAIASIVTVVALLVACYAIYSSRNNNGIHNVNLDSYNASVYHIVTDYVMLVKDTIIEGVVDEIVVESAAFENPLSATCFLTDDGKFVTARHCIEPWVADESWDGAFEMAMPAEVRLAVLAETANRNGEGKWRVRTHCTISRDGESYEYLSDDFFINREHDLVLQLGSRERPLWLRTIIPVANRRDMELGDLVYVESPKGLKGAFAMADIEDLNRFDQQTNRDIAILGYPQKENDNEALTLTFGNGQHIALDGVSSRIKGCIQMSAQINQGNSGGPILALIGNKIKVIGIVSKVDIYASQGTFWAVPATEITHATQSKTNDDELSSQDLYRR